MIRSSSASASRFTAVILAIAAAWSPDVALAATARFGDIEITEIPCFGGDTRHGYVEFAYSITNRSARARRQVEIVLPRQSYGVGQVSISQLSRSVLIEPGATVRLPLWQGPLPIHGGGVGVRIDGQWQDEQIHSSQARHMLDLRYSSGRGASMPRPTLLITPSMNQSDVQAMVEKAAGKTGKARGGPAATGDKSVIRADVPVSQWPVDWLAYTSLDLVMIGSREWQDAPPGVREAIERYVMAGGVLALAGAIPLPEHWRESHQTAHFEIAPVGFGVVMMAYEPQVSRWNETPFQMLIDQAKKTAQPFADRRDVKEANAVLQVVEQFTVPVRGLFALMLLFAVAIGPVNLVVLGRMKRRIWLLWTAPAISLAFCAALFAYNALAEGWTSYSRMRTFTILDHRSRQAATIGAMAYYSPLSVGGGLVAPLDMELTPQFGDARSDGRPCTVRWSDRQHLDSGWISARLPCHFQFRQVGPQRQRIDFIAQPDGSVVAVNGFKSPVRRLRYVDAEGRIHECASIAAGARQTLGPTGETTAADRHRLRDKYESDWFTSGHATFDAALLVRGTYLAEMEGQPLVDSLLIGAEPLPGECLVFGILERVQP